MNQSRPVLRPPALDEPDTIESDGELEGHVHVDPTARIWIPEQGRYSRSAYLNEVYSTQHSPLYPPSENTQTSSHRTSIRPFPESEDSQVTKQFYRSNPHLHVRDERFPSPPRHHSPDAIPRLRVPPLETSRTPYIRPVVLGPYSDDAYEPRHSTAHLVGPMSSFTTDLTLALEAIPAGPSPHLSNESNASTGSGMSMGGKSARTGREGEDSAGDESQEEIMDSVKAEEGGVSRDVSNGTGSQGQG
ncbi:hypothetical protein JCM16303_006605 [Sporobolomyces ruberrimus]